MTVIITCYREGALLYRAMDSLDKQTDQDFEIVIVNDASPCPETNRICEEFSARGNVRLIVRQKNGGLSAARNDGFAAAKDGFCISYDADDELPPRAVEIIREYAQRHPSADFFFGNYLRRDLESNEEQVVDCSHLAGGDGWLDPHMLATHWRLLGQSPCRRSAWERIGGYCQKYSYDYQDVDFWMRLVGSGCQGVYIPQTLYIWHRSISGMNAAMKVHRSWEVTLDNRRFQQCHGDWDTVCEGFLAYVISNSTSPEARSLMWRYGWRLWPGRCHSLFFRAWARMILPDTVIRKFAGRKQK